MTKARRSAFGLRLSINLFLGLLVFFIASQCVQAQWATNGNNINNTNTGNVGIGPPVQEPHWMFRATHSLWVLISVPPPEPITP